MFKFRASDNQIGRFFSIDPVASDYSYNSPYNLQENKFGLGVLATKAGSSIIKTESAIVKEASITQKTTISEQAESLVSANSGKNRVSLRSEKSQVDVDLRGEPHFDKKTNTTYDTPHTKTSPRNTQAPENQGIRYNTTEKHAEYSNTTQQEIRTVRKYLKKQ